MIQRLKEKLPNMVEAIPGLFKKTENEFAGPCPKCSDGEDRFIVWSDKQKFWCRQCEWRGDVIDYFCWKDDTDTKGLARKYLTEPDKGQKKGTMTWDFN